MTWYSYDINDINLVLRIFDFLLSNMIIKKDYVDVILASKLIIYLINFFLKEKIDQEKVIYEIYDKKLKNINLEEINFILRETDYFMIKNYSLVCSLLNQSKNSDFGIFYSSRIIKK